MKPVIVTWHDAHADQGGSWVSRHDIDADPYVVRSVGFVFDPPPKPGHVTVCQSIGDGEMFDNLLHIPLGWIASILPLGD